MPVSMYPQPRSDRRCRSTDQRATQTIDVVDGADDIFFYAARQDDVPSALRDALGELDGVTWSGPADLEAAQWPAAVRYLAAIREGAEDPETFFTANVTEQSSIFDDNELEPPTLEEIRSLWGVLDKHAIGQLSADEPLGGLDRWFAAVRAVHRAM